MHNQEKNSKREKRRRKRENRTEEKIGACLLNDLHIRSNHFTEKEKKKNEERIEDEKESING